jgi:hypothetical protein
VDRVRIGEQKPFALSCLGSRADGICLTGPLRLERCRIEDRDLGKFEGDGAGGVGRTVIHQQQFPILVQGKALDRLGQQNLICMPKWVMGWLPAWLLCPPRSCGVPPGEP